MTDVDVNKNIETEFNTQLKLEIVKKLGEYRKTMSYMAADAPISILGIPKCVENVLCNNGLLRVYDLFDCDFTKIKGLSKSRINDLTTSIDEFLSML